ncbi:Imm32 family immunity protein [Streptomyces althioticus]|uniref:Imm32 family immunity protein n=1 Tax=Streptomyces althioticus TaxID=83380 RepID=UPI003F4D2A56
MGGRRTHQRPQPARGDRHRGQLRRVEDPGRPPPHTGQDGTPDGAHLHLEESNGLEDGSARLVLERCDDA